jgi:dihydrofolate reductase
MALPPSSGLAKEAALAVIAAVARNGVIGAGNALPWRLPADLARFRALTLGHSVVMGRRTWDSIARPLPGRQNIVVTRHAQFAAAGVDVAHSLPEALSIAHMPKPAFCIGGGELYRLALPIADVLYITEIERDFEGDARFPEFDRSDFRVIAREEGEAPEGFRYAFVTYVRQ